MLGVDLNESNMSWTSSLATPLAVSSVITLAITSATSGQPQRNVTDQSCFRVPGEIILQSYYVIMMIMSMVITIMIMIIMTIIMIMMMNIIMIIIMIVMIIMIMNMKIFLSDSVKGGFNADFKVWLNEVFYELKLTIFILSSKGGQVVIFMKDVEIVCDMVKYVVISYFWTLRVRISIFH